MEFQSYNEELAIANILFKRIFSNIKISRTDQNGQTSELLVQCMLGQRSRILKNYENPEKRGNIKLPLIAINRTGYTRNAERLNNLNNEVKYEMTSCYRNLELMTPVPVDISYDVVVMAKYPSDIDKIASNFMVFFNNDIFVSCEHPKYKGVKMNNQVVMGDSVSEEHQDEIDGSTDDIVTATFTFTFKTFLFSGTTKAKLKIAKAAEVSTYTSSFLSNIILDIPADQIDDFQREHPDQDVSAIMPSVITAELSTYVDVSTDVSVYDNIPNISRIEFGLYSVPYKEPIEPYIMSVDTIFDHYHTDLSGFISSDLCGFVHGDMFGKVDENCSLEPYVDKVIWSIDGIVKY